MNKSIIYKAKDVKEIREDLRKLKDLQQEPCEDAVSRQAVCNIVDAIRDCISVEGYWAILERLKKLPSVNPQPKTGHWIKTGYVDKVTCSICKRKMWNFWEVNDFNYCPNCGAKMVEPHESNDGMTSEEAKELLDNLIGMVSDNQESDYDTALKMGIKALKQEKEPILDKIRAEIEELKPNNPNFKGYFEQNVALNKVLKVIDKYKAESEGKE